MVRNRNIPALDPATEKPLASGVTYRGPGQCRARKLVNGHRLTKTFATARFTGRWLTEIQVDSARGLFVDRSEAARHTLGQIICRYRDEILGEDSEKRGAEKERGHRRECLDSKAHDGEYAPAHPPQLLPPRLIATLGGNIAVVCFRPRSPLD